MPSSSPSCVPSTTNRIATESPSATKSCSCGFRSGKAPMNPRNSPTRFSAPSTLPHPPPVPLHAGGAVLGRKLCFVPVEHPPHVLANELDIRFSCSHGSLQSNACCLARPEVFVGMLLDRPGDRIHGILSPHRG